MNTFNTTSVCINHINDFARIFEDFKLLHVNRASVSVKLPKLYNNEIVNITTKEYNRILSGDFAEEYRVVLCENGTKWIEALRWSRF